MFIERGCYMIDPLEDKPVGFKEPSILFLTIGSQEIFYSSNYLGEDYEEELELLCKIKCIYTFKGKSYVRRQLFLKFFEKDHNFISTVERKVLAAVSEFHTKCYRQPEPDPM